MRDSTPVTYQWVLNDFIVQNHDALIAGLHRPLVFPLDFVNYGLLITYLFATRHYSRIPRYVNWAVFLIIVWLSLSTMRECRSLGMSYGIGIGLMSSWCILLSANLSIYHNPKEDFLRISRRQGRMSPHQDLLGRKQSSGVLLSPSSPSQSAPFAWQSMPCHFFERLDWILDLVSNFRGVNWSWRFNGATPNPSELVCKNLTLTATIVRSALIDFCVFYLVIDGLKAIMVTDPYFLGHTTDPQPQSLPFFRYEPFVRTYHTIISFAAIYASLVIIFSMGPLICVGLLGPGLIGVRGERWMYPPCYGPFSAVLDRGLRGWWGQWWHQTFRFTFSSPGTWPAKKLRVTRRDQVKALEIVLAFMSSGSLHICGTYTLWADTRTFRPFWFFALQPIGMVVQHYLVQALQYVCSSARFPRSARRAGNLMYTLAWLWITFPLLADELARGGLWLYEPLPISILRGLGWSTEEKQWWCWHGTWFKWHTGQRWWQSGVAI